VRGLKICRTKKLEVREGGRQVVVERRAKKERERKREFIFKKSEREMSVR